MCRSRRVVLQKYEACFEAYSDPTTHNPASCVGLAGPRRAVGRIRVDVTECCSNEEDQSQEFSCGVLPDAGQCLWREFLLQLLLDSMFTTSRFSLLCVRNDHPNLHPSHCNDALALLTLEPAQYVAAAVGTGSSEEGM